MHATALQLIPVFAAEKSRVAFYVFASALAAWAVLVSLGIGLRRSGFPANIGGERIVMLVSAVLVIATMASGVITSGTPSKAANSGGSTARTTQEPAATTGSPSAPSTTGETPESAGSSVKFATNPEGQLAYDTKRLQAKAGEVTVTLTNAAPLAHNVTIAQGGKVLGATPTFQGGSRKLTLRLKPGTYTFYCSIPGHRQAGMEGTLKVS
ncbi:MAG TPA: plastocyanin/azurin family copper-binding protein [Solirubrobacteraceae bacterium]|jgi:plastocyanin